MITHQPLYISLRQLVDNPTGKGSAYMAKRAMIKQGLNMTYIKILQRYRKQFYAMPYVYPDGRILFHVKVPSEMYNINHISYDVLFEFQTNSKQRLALRDVKCFSNSPSFIFTYAYVFYHKNMVIPAFSSNLPNECKTMPPVVRNPIESMGYEKSIYIASRYLLDSFALTDKYIERFGKACNSLVETDIQRRIADSRNLVSIYQHALYLQAKSHRKPISKDELHKRNERSNRFIENQKRMRPEGRKNIFGVRVAPRPKLTARAAKRAILNDNTKKSRVIKPTRTTRKNK